jgi:hypothetical protein
MLRQNLQMQLRHLSGETTRCVHSFAAHKELFLKPGADVLILKKNRPKRGFKNGDFEVN